jgi:LAO/AO transport system kinase
MSDLILSDHDEQIITAISRGDARACGRLISRAESDDESVVSILQALYMRGGNTPIIGITGPPGAGKSTLTDQLIERWRARGERIAVLAVDPSSPFSGGAILGDRVRMNRHNVDTGVFIRSMSARSRLGGLAAATGDTLTILDAMGFARILIETVGVGQNELEIMRHAHSVVILQTPGAGDVVQSVKAGLLEIGDVFAVNKADLPAADKVVTTLREAVAFRHDAHNPDDWQPPIVKTQSVEGTGVDELLAAIENHLQHQQQHPAQRMRRLRDQARARLLDLVSEGLRRRYASSAERQDNFEQQLDALLERRSDPHAAAWRVLGKI